MHITVMSLSYPGRVSYCTWHTMCCQNNHESYHRWNPKVWDVIACFPTSHLPVPLLSVAFFNTPYWPLFSKPQMSAFWGPHFLVILPNHPLIQGLMVNYCNSNLHGLATILITHFLCYWSSLSERQKHRQRKAEESAEGNCSVFCTEWNQPALLEITTIMQIWRYVWSTHPNSQTTKSLWHHPVFLFSTCYSLNAAIFFPGFLLHISVTWNQNSIKRNVL